MNKCNRERRAVDYLRYALDGMPILVLPILWCCVVCTDLRHGIERQTGWSAENVHADAPWALIFATINGIHGPRTLGVMPYVYQLPVDQKVEGGLTRTLSFHSRLTLYR